jgi:CO/xanthine dehydrogenase Mo-binding subunit
VVRVELDEDIRVTHGWAAVDAGEAVNPDGIANQIEGGLVQAASWTLKEQIGFEGEAVATRDWESYPILTFAEVPETRVEIIDRPELEPLGVGEAAQGPTAAAIANALARAAGARVRALPITRDKLAAALA